MRDAGVVVRLYTTPTDSSDYPKQVSNASVKPKEWVRPRDKFISALQAGQICQKKDDSGGYQCLMCNKDLKNKQTMTSHLTCKQHQDNVCSLYQIKLSVVSNVTKVHSRNFDKEIN